MIRWRQYTTVAYDVNGRIGSELSCSHARVMRSLPSSSVSCSSLLLLCNLSFRACCSISFGRLVAAPDVGGDLIEFPLARLLVDVIFIDGGRTTWSCMV